MSVHTAQIAAAQGHAVAIEEFENLDRNLAPVVEAVAQLRGDELAFLGVCREVRDDLDHLGDGATQKEMVLRDLVHPAHATEQLEEAPHLAFLHAKQTRDVAHARRTEALGAEQRANTAPQFLVLWRQTDLVARELYPCPLEDDFALACERLQ